MTQTGCDISTLHRQSEIETESILIDTNQQDLFLDPVFVSGFLFDKGGSLHPDFEI